MSVHAGESHATRSQRDHGQALETSLWEKSGPSKGRHVEAEDNLQPSPPCGFWR